MGSALSGHTISITCTRLRGTSSLLSSVFIPPTKSPSPLEHTELCSVSCGSLDGRGVWGRTDMYICMAESLHCLLTLLTGYTPIQNKKLKISPFLLDPWSMTTQWIKHMLGI